LSTPPGRPVQIGGSWPVANIDMECPGTVLMAAGDDMELGFLVGPPAIWTNTV